MPVRRQSAPTPPWAPVARTPTPTARPAGCQTPRVWSMSRVGKLPDGRPRLDYRRLTLVSVQLHAPSEGTDETFESSPASTPAARTPRGAGDPLSASAATAPSPASACICGCSSPPPPGSHHRDGAGPCSRCGAGHTADHRVRCGRHDQHVHTATVTPAAGELG